VPVDAAQPLPALIAAWCFLGQVLKKQPASTNEFWEYAIEHWRLSNVPQCRTQSEKAATPVYRPPYSR
jgi:glutamyl-Q tRNA(Asp) synthetase